jgi:hypothetical protein
MQNWPAQTRASSCPASSSHWSPGNEVGWIGILTKEKNPINSKSLDYAPKAKNIYMSWLVQWKTTKSCDQNDQLFWPRDLNEFWKRLIKRLCAFWIPSRAVNTLLTVSVIFDYSWHHIATSYKNVSVIFIGCCMFCPDYDLI